MSFRYSVYTKNLQTIHSIQHAYLRNNYLDWPKEFQALQTKYYRVEQFTLSRLWTEFKQLCHILFSKSVHCYRLVNWSLWLIFFLHLQKWIWHCSILAKALVNKKNLHCLQEITVTILIFCRDRITQHSQLFYSHSHYTVKTKVSVFMTSFSST